ncbi:hypothetical protein GCM10017673_46760 [Streptosporangium violaceochromogenes]|nr:hypothetical protein GCM10017673_46760 [Streptosporangium violaceochromogenes]
MLALTPVWVKPQRGQAGSTGGGFRIVVVVPAGEEAVNSRPVRVTRSAAPPEEQLAMNSAAATIPTEVITRPGRRPADSLLPDDT